MELVHFEVSAGGPIGQFKGESEKFVCDAKANALSSETTNLTPFGSI
jgi:hypothetical protein